MEIPNYDKKETTNNFKQLYDYMPDRCFRMLICGKTINFIMIRYACI